MAVISGSELAMDRMDLRNGGRGGLIINTASLAGIASAMSRESASYFIAKHGVVSLTRALGVGFNISEIRNFLGFGSRKFYISSC